MRRLLAAFLIAFIAALPTFADAADRGSPAEAQALVEKAIAAFNADRKKALADISDPRGPFVNRDLYVFVFGPDTKIVAHGADRRLIGRTAASFRDIDGKRFALDFMKATPEGIWVDYRWMNPVTKSVEQKTSFVKKADGYVFGAGAYKP
jgi:signal transduction histidine kinase